MRSPVEVVRRLRGQQWLSGLALVAALAFAGYHLVGFVQQAGSLRAYRDDAIAPWMTVGHVAHTFGVPEEALEAAIGLEGGSHDRRPLRIIALQRRESFESIRDRLQEAIARLTPPPAPDPLRPSSDAPAQLPPPR